MFMFGLSGERWKGNMRKENDRRVRNYSLVEGNYGGRKRKEKKRGSCFFPKPTIFFFFLNERYRTS